MMKKSTYHRLRYGLILALCGICNPVTPFLVIPMFAPQVPAVPRFIVAFLICAVFWLLFLFGILFKSALENTDYHKFQAYWDRWHNLDGSEIFRSEKKELVKTEDK